MEIDTLVFGSKITLSLSNKQRTLLAGSNQTSCISRIFVLVTDDFITIHIVDITEHALHQKHVITC